MPMHVLIACADEEAAAARVVDRVQEDRTGTQGRFGSRIAVAGAGRDQGATTASRGSSFNRWAVRLNLPIYWIADGNNDRARSRGRSRRCCSIRRRCTYVTDGASPPSSTKAYDQILAAAEGNRRATTSASSWSARISTQGRADARAVGLQEAVGRRQAVRRSHDEGGVARSTSSTTMQNGAAALAAQLPADPASHSLFRRNRGPKCVAPNDREGSDVHGDPGQPEAGRSDSIRRSCRRTTSSVRRSRSTRNAKDADGAVRRGARHARRVDRGAVHRGLQGRR